jgi:AraC-like DNA-binding protein
MESRLLSECSRVFEHADPYAVSSYVNQHVGAHCIRMPDRGQGAADLNHRKLASLDLCRISYGASVRVTSAALDTIYHLQILLRGHCLSRGAQEDLYLTPGELLLINPDDPVDLTYSEDCEKFILKMPRGVLDDLWREQRWDVPQGGVRFVQNRYRLADLDGFAGLLGMLCHEAEAADSMLRVQEHYQQIIAGKMLSLMNTNVQRPASGLRNPTFERLNDYIERNLKLDIHPDDLARQAQISSRALYTLFERHAGVSPKLFIRRKKFERVHACLSDPQCHVRSVTEIALDYGFLHLGRFSENYRLLFGELPSQTFKRHR